MLVYGGYDSEWRWWGCIVEVVMDDDDEDVRMVIVVVLDGSNSF